MLKRHGPAIAATLVLAGLISGVVISAATPVPETNALPRIVKAHPAITRVEAKAGQEVWFSWAGTFALRGQNRAVVTAIELVRVPPGLRVLKVRAASTKHGAPAPVPPFAGPLLIPTPALRPITTVVLEPGASNDETYFLAGVVAEKPGTYRLEGWRLHYQSGGIAGISQYDQGIEIHVS